MCKPSGAPTDAYGHRLLGIDLDTSEEFEREIVRGCEGIKPGWIRVNFNYFLSETEASYLIDAIHLVANDGWRVMPHYDFDPDTGQWRHRSRRDHGVQRLTDVSYRAGRPEFARATPPIRRPPCGATSTRPAASLPPPRPSMPTSARRAAYDPGLRGPALVPAAGRGARELRGQGRSTPSIVLHP